MKGRTVEVLSGPLAGMRGVVLEPRDGGWLVSLHGESEEHEGSYVAFQNSNLILAAEPDDEPRWLVWARNLFWMVCGAVIGATCVYLGFLP